MIINDFNAVGVSVVPCEAKTPPFIDSDTVLPLTVANKLLEMISRRHPKVLQTDGNLQLPYLSHRDPFYRPESRNANPPCKQLRILILKRAYQ